MPKFKVCITKIEEYSKILEVEAENDLEAKRNAMIQIRDQINNGKNELMWVENKIKQLKAEVIHG